MDKWYAHFSASVRGVFSRWGATDVGEFFPSDGMFAGITAVGEQMDHRGSLLWGRYEMDCCRFVAGRFGSDGAVEKGGTMLELEGVRENDSRFEVARCSWRGGKECRLVGVVIFNSKLKALLQR